mgnify:CR=1 FL=1
MSMKFKVWHIPQVPMSPFERGAETYVEAVLIQSLLADYDAFEFEHRVKGDYCNASGIVATNADNPTEDDWEDVQECDTCGGPAIGDYECEGCIEMMGTAS